MCDAFAADYKVEISGDWATFSTRSWATHTWDLYGLRSSPEWVPRFAMPVGIAVELFTKITKQHAAAKRRREAFVDPSVA